MMKLTGEIDKRRHVESMLCCAETETEKLKLERVRLQIKIDELKLKLQEGNNNFNNLLYRGDNSTIGVPDTRQYYQIFAKNI